MTSVKLGLNADEAKIFKATLGILIMIGVWIAFAILGVFLESIIDGYLLVVLLVGVGNVYTCIAILVHLIFKTRIEDMPANPIAIPSPELQKTAPPTSEPSEVPP